MVYAGIDYSITCPAITIFDDEEGKAKIDYNTCLFFFYQSNVSDREQERREELNLSRIFPQRQFEWKNNYNRYFALADFFMSIIISYNVNIVCIENYALGANGQVFGIAEATGILKHLIMLTGCELYAFPPASVKKCFANYGKAEKGFMINTFKKRYNVDIPALFEKDGMYVSPYSDIVDSFAMIYTYINFSKEDREKFKLF